MAKQGTVRGFQNAFGSSTLIRQADGKYTVTNCVAGIQYTLSNIRYTEAKKFHDLAAAELKALGGKGAQS